MYGKVEEIYAAHSGVKKFIPVKNESTEYAIYKIPKIYEYVKLSPKRILQIQKEFSDHMNWRKHSVIQINEEGKIESVKHAVMRATMNNKYYTYVVVE